MKIVVSANGADPDASASPVFGRCPTYIFVERVAQMAKVLARLDQLEKGEGEEC